MEVTVVLVGVQILMWVGKHRTMIIFAPIIFTRSTTTQAQVAGISLA